MNENVKKLLIIIAAVIAIMLIGSACTDETTTYYQDLNGNGKADIGEGVWYEDKNGTHFFD